jgi:hypothetical protein
MLSISLEFSQSIPLVTGWLIRLVIITFLFYNTFNIVHVICLCFRPILDSKLVDMFILQQLYSKSNPIKESKNIPIKVNNLLIISSRIGPLQCGWRCQVGEPIVAVVINHI